MTRCNVFREAPRCHQPGAGTRPRETMGNFHAKHQQEDIGHLSLRCTLEENGSPPGRVRNNAKQVSCPEQELYSRSSELRAFCRGRPTGHPTTEEPGTATSSPPSPGPGVPPRLLCSRLGSRRAGSGLGNGSPERTLEPQRLQTNAVTGKPQRLKCNSAETVPLLSKGPH